MNFIFHFPDLGEGLEEGTILAWYVTEGQQVNEGDPLVQMETDKVVADIPSPKKGVIVLLHGSVGDVIKVGTPLVEIKTEDADGVQQSGQVETTKEKVITEPVSESEEDAGAVVGTVEVAGKDALLPESNEGSQELPTTVKAPQKVLATPVARAMAKEMGIDINKVRAAVLRAG
jgi:pyruvate dehydrogenase E2 component (dihydrolipoamide acetyltransferase)